MKLQKGLILRSKDCAPFCIDEELAPLKPSLILYDSGKWKETQELLKFLHSSSSSSSTITTTLFEFAHLISGICCIDRFIASNFTGPASSFENEKDTSTELLCIDGETPLSGRIYCSELLIQAKDHFSHCQNILTTPWWIARLSFLHQRVMSNPCSTLKTTIDENYSSTLSTIALHFDEDEQLESCALLERSLVHRYYKETSRCKKTLSRVISNIELKVELAGAMGKRTKYQDHDTSLLYLAVISQKHAPDTRLWARLPLPEESQLETDSDLLDHLVFTDAIDACLLSPLEQAVVLCLGSEKALSGPPGDQTRTEEALAHIERVLRDPSDWSVHCMALLSKSRLEKYSHKTAPRASNQLLALSKCYLESVSESRVPAKVRVSMQHFVIFPSHIELQKELAYRLAEMGDPASALKVFEETNMLDEAALCLYASGQKQRAEELCRKRLHEKETADMLCVLGDITGEKEHYIRAWELKTPGSGRYARAKRSLGHWYFQRSQWEEAINHYRDALNVNSLFDRCWFALGCACMQLSRWDEALGAFTRVVSIEPEDGEAWSNIAAVHMHKGMAHEAHGSLQEALKYKPESWKIWQNFILVCCSPQVRDFRNAMNGIGRILDLASTAPQDAGLRRPDARAVFALVNAVVQNIPTRSGDGASALKPQLEKLLVRIERDSDMSPALWDIISMYSESIEDWKTAQSRRSHHAHSLEGAWPGDAKRWADISDAYLQLGKTSLKLNDNSVLPKLKEVMERAKQHHGKTQEYASLIALISKLESLPNK